jgi:site-specific DNA-methyltransferase (adenine-specific)
VEATHYIRTADVPLDELTPFPGNAKRGDVDQIRASLRRNGQYRSLVVREIPDGPLIVLAGNHTMQALAAEGHETARCEVVLCDEDTARRINLADNRTAELGGYDNDALAELLSYLDGDYEGTGYTDADIDELLGEEAVALTDPDDIPAPPVEPVTQPGDIWNLGPHRVLCGDSTDIAAVEAMLDGDRADCMWTDPPYGVDYMGKTKDALTIRNDGADGLPELLAGAFAVVTAVLKPGAPFYIAHPPGPDSIVFWEAVRAAGWLHRQNLVWDKGVMVLGRSDYHYQHEPLIYGFTDPEPGSGRLGRGGDRWYGDNAQTSVFHIPKPARSESHPTMKPVELITAHLGNSCPRGGIVYEPFGGSGSTLIAAHATGRTARLVELDHQYVDVICRRYQTHTGTRPILAATGQEHDFTAELANQ